MRRAVCAAVGFCALSVPGAGAVSLPTLNQGSGTLVEKVHSLYEAEHSLRELGYYDIYVERASLPYSFQACKHGVRYHIHVNYFGDLVQVDELGRCRDYGYGEFSYRRRFRGFGYDY